MTQTAAIGPEIIIVDDSADEVMCDGGGGALGHPVVWYNLNDTGRSECMYCDRLFIKKSAATRSEKQKAS